MNFEVNLIFLIKPFFPYDQKVMTKGYLCYKTITSQKVPSEAQIKEFFYFVKNYVPLSRYSSFCIFNYSMTYNLWRHDEY